MQMALSTITTLTVMASACVGYVDNPADTTSLCATCTEATLKVR